MAKETIYLTKEGYEKLKKELDTLKQKLMFEIAERIKEARELGDLSENSEYQEAKNEQGRIAARVNELENMLSKAEVIESLGTNSVNIGNWVIIKNLDTNEEKKIQIVTPHEADVFQNKISIESPLGRALVGKKVGEIVKIKAPNGAFKYEILGIQI
ncbi:transcription elongation factor GreA [Thermosipho atlanticus]|uniref:Transcription elongation factor GreA n=1 Tax=Thermosipho atlanticus DSM 15807 TaxID=1123380 RepID=A0A1M5QXW2_9BACT|nr:transcription elongation factor GreA [Thermosipho atlanticus]SHH19037.1 transcription elongation factor GreA [Thermosipho atlanticus DSM 15807]